VAVIIEWFVERSGAVAPGQYAEAVKASILAHDPTGQNTVETAIDDLETAEATEASRGRREAIMRLQALGAHGSTSASTPWA
jgi:predicted metal-dependent TIM-barrel fold hydrolase